MKRVLIFGTGSTGRKIYGELKCSLEVVGFLDNDPAKRGVSMAYLYGEMEKI